MKSASRKYWSVRFEPALNNLLEARSQEAQIPKIEVLRAALSFLWAEDSELNNWLPAQIARDSDVGAKNGGSLSVLNYEGEAALNALAKKWGTPPATLARCALREFLESSPPRIPSPYAQQLAAQKAQIDELVNLATELKLRVASLEKKVARLETGKLLGKSSA